MTYHFQISQEADGYWAHCLELEGCFKQAETLESLQTHMQEALDLYLEDLHAPLPPNTSLIHQESVVAVTQKKA